MSSDARFQLRVQRYGWDKAAAVYEQYWGEQLAPAQRRLLELAALAPGERVIDIAAGTGLVTFPAAEAVGPGGAVVATDLSEVMVAGITGEAARRGFTNVTAVRTDAEEQTGDAASFDVALCSLGLMYIPDPLAALREMHRVVRPGGRVVVAVWGARSNCGWAEIFPIVDHRVRSEVCPMFFQLGGGDALRMALEASGLADVTSEHLPATLSYATAEAACGAAFAGGPVALAYARFDDATKTEVHAEYLASIATYRQGGGYQVPGEFVVARGMRS